MYKKCLLPMILFAVGCFNSVVTVAQVNTLTSQEKQQGWKLLFDGKDLQGWHSYLQSKPGKTWEVSDEAIFLNKTDKSTYQDCGDLTTDAEFENFDFKMIQVSDLDFVIFFICQEKKSSLALLTKIFNITSEMHEKHV